MSTNKPTKFESYQRALAKRKATFGYEGRDFVAKNSGIARNEPKRALLRKLAELKSGPSR